MPKNKKIKKTTPEKAIIKKFTEQEAIDYISKSTSFDCSPSSITKKMTEELNKGELIRGGDVPKDSATFDYISMQGLDNQMFLASECNEDFSPLILKLSQDLTKEYDCKTPSEKALVHIACSAYQRILRCSRSFNSSMHPDFISHEKASFLNIYSKELDRANRHFISAIQTLKAFKQPQLKMNIKTNNAYLAQNQQINTVDEEATKTTKNHEQIIDEQ